MRILLHICCGPCAIYPVEHLLREGFEVIGLFYNPNIHPLKEYLKRREALVKTAQKLGIKILFKDEDYDPNLYFREVVYRENNRCFYCYHLRINKTINIAKRGKFDYFTTTLLYSKFQQHENIVNICNDLSKGKVRFYYFDFRQGWSEGIEKSKQWNIYRQQYCGCIYSEFERYKRELNNKHRACNKNCVNPF